MAFSQASCLLGNIISLSIHSDCESLVNTINTYMHRRPLYYEIQYLQNRSLLLRILEEIRGRSGTTTLTYVKAHQQDSQPTSSAPSLDSTSRHQEYNKIVDRLAKNSLTSDGPPLAPVNVILPVTNPTASLQSIICENNPQKLYHTAYASNPHLHYHLRGTWHLYVFDDSIWHDPSTSTMLSKREFLHEKFLVQILGRTLPTFRRLNKIQPRLYLTNNCILCPQNGNVEESIEHLLFHCPFFSDRRHLLHAQLISTCRRLSLPIVTTTLRTIIRTLLAPPFTRPDPFLFRRPVTLHLGFVSGFNRTISPTPGLTNSRGNVFHRTIVEAFHDI
jgi:hypothetical protein